MRAHYLQHVPFEGPGCIAPWLTGAGFELTATRFFAGERLPDPAALDLLVVMGGPMGANDDAALPWLAPEVGFIRSVIDRGTPVLGVCLGAQLVARALGARVFRNDETEIGWFPVRGLARGDDAVFRFPQMQTVFHWHGDTFELPEGAVRLASSNACRNQAFQFGNSAIALQCHLEVTPESVAGMVAEFRSGLTPARYVQPEEDLLSVDVGLYEAANALMGDVLAFLLRRDG